MERIVPVVLAASLGWTAGAAQDPPRPVDFARDVKPILDAHCISCHGPTKHKADYRVDTYDAAIEGSPGGKSIVPGSPGGSDFFRRLVSDDSDLRMPQKEGRLAARDVETIRRWIEEGAKPVAASPASGHWAFVAPVEPATPTVKARAWIRNPVDRFVLARLEADGAAPPAEAPEDELLRRLRVDLTGAPLDAVEVTTLDGEVERLLASNAYAERMAGWWIDLVHASASPAQHARIVEAFAKDLPFDAFAVEQMTGDLVSDATLEKRAGELWLGVPLATAVEKLGAPRPGDRGACSRWIASTGNPLFARVAVNRIWALFFDQGIVATPDDFGEHGAPPSNRELLDWLALDFAASGWSVRGLVKRIVSSATYRQARMHSER